MRGAALAQEIHGGIDAAPENPPSSRALQETTLVATSLTSFRDHGCAYIVFHVRTNALLGVTLMPLAP